jgi:hypothetical protein|tara:strand:+ start:344 stop:673 length:330 start_codon:yes stop_codon:yes gene_type:complete
MSETIKQLLTEVESHCCTIQLDGDRLAIQNGSKLPADLLERVRHYKPQLITYLENHPATHLDGITAGLLGRFGGQVIATMSIDEYETKFNTTFPCSNNLYRNGETNNSN